jgi:tryptophan synthase beta chain
MNNFYINTKKVPHRYYLTEEQIPTQFYNMRADMKNKPEPHLNPATMKPVTREDLLPVFPEGLVDQELDDETPYFDIPDEVREVYKMYRPSPLIRAYHLEQVLDTPAKIYFKFEGNNTSGSHKLNSAIVQAYYAKKQGLAGLTTETGAGQWGTALAEACSYFGLPLTVYMVKISYEQKPFRKSVIKTFGAGIVPSPSDTTAIGRLILEKNPGTTGSLGCAISEAVEKAVSTQDYRYSLGSCLNYVLLHQSIIGIESKIAMEEMDEYPDIVIGCAGGGSNLGGLISVFFKDKINGIANPRLIAVEPASCPSFTRGRFAYDFCDTGRITPLAKMYTLGSQFIPSPDHAGGLRYHGMSPILSQLYHDGLLEAVAVNQIDVFSAAQLFAKTETILPAPESAHAIRTAIDEALICKETGEKKTILFGLSGTGYFDMKAYDAYLQNKMVNTNPSDEELQKSFADLPSILA